MFEFFNNLIRNAIIIAAISVTAGFVMLKIPRSFLLKKLHSYNKSYPFEQEGKLYDKYFHINKWKDRLPQFSSIFNKGFSKTNIRSLDPEYLDLFILETVRAEHCHIVLIITSPIYFWLNKSFDWGLVMCLFSVFANIPFIMIQRFNRPRIEKIKLKMETKKKTEDI